MTMRYNVAANSPHVCGRNYKIVKPLSYIGGVVQGKPGLSLRTRNISGEYCLKRADVAFAEKDVKSVVLGAN